MFEDNKQIAQEDAKLKSILYIVAFAFMELSLSFWILLKFEKGAPIESWMPMVSIIIAIVLSLKAHSGTQLNINPDQSHETLEKGPPVATLYISLIFIGLTTLSLLFSFVVAINAVPQLEYIIKKKSKERHKNNFLINRLSEKEDWIRYENNALNFFAEYPTHPEERIYTGVYLNGSETKRVQFTSKEKLFGLYTYSIEIENYIDTNTGEMLHVSPQEQIAAYLEENKLRIKKYEYLENDESGVVVRIEFGDDKIMYMKSFNRNGSGYHQVYETISRLEDIYDWNYFKESLIFI